MGIRQQALGHAHRQERCAALFDEAPDRIIGLRVGGALAENNQRSLGALERVERAHNSLRRGDLGGRCVNDLHQRFASGLRVHDLPEQLCRQVEINAPRPSGQSGADRSRYADADIGGMQHAERRLAERLGDGKLIHLLVIALLQVNDLALGRTRNQDHGEAVGRGVCQRGKAIEEAGRRHREADPGLLGEETRNGGGVSGILLVAE
jgi:hypothetical protein